MTPFDIRFFALLKERIAELHSAFPDRFSASEDWAEAKKEVGYREALLDIEAIGEDIERKLNGGE